MHFSPQLQIEESRTVLSLLSLLLLLLLLEKVGAAPLAVSRDQGRGSPPLHFAAQYREQAKQQIEGEFELWILSPLLC